MTDVTSDPEQKIAIVRALVVILNSRRLIFSCVVVTTLIAATIGWVHGRRWQTRATVEIALRTATEPLENPVLARERLRGIIERRKAETGLDMTVDVQNRYAATDQKITRLIDVKATSETSSAARTLLDQSLEEFVADHRAKRATEVALLEMEKKRLEEIAGQVRGVIQVRGDESIERESEQQQKKKANSLSEALILIHRRSFEIGRLVGSHRNPDTRIIEPTSVPRRSLNPVVIYALAGALTGMLIAGLVLLFRTTEQPARKRRAEAAYRTPSRLEAETSPS